MTKAQTVAQITPRKWEMYLTEWKDEKGVQDEDESEDEDESDGKDDDFWYIPEISEPQSTGHHHTHARMSR